MFLKSLDLQNFRSYSKATFDFSENTTIIVGPNTAGKTNLIEAIFLLSRGKSFRAEKDIQMIAFGQDLARVKGKLANEEKVELEAVLTTGRIGGVEAPLKRFLVNGVAKRRVDFITHLPTVLFSPVDLEIIVDSPSTRRNFLDDVLEQIDHQYRLALVTYGKALRQRNALLEVARESGVRREGQFEYWDKILIENGNLLTLKREEFIVFINRAKKEVFDFTVLYDKSTISKERLLQYKDAEVGAAATLVGPHRDDLSIRINPSSSNESESVDVKLFGSRGQQRLVVLQLKLIALSFIESRLGVRPVLLLDDIFSELDEDHIRIIYDILHKQQTILTTTHEEFIDKRRIRDASVVKL
ncbi:MAG: DNA replication and repair protein RecF [Candidatus Levybacteria bacterium]|nr:DNA replication and repair protein RecF [Candidatus Levybacteria bacterium]